MVATSVEVLALLGNAAAVDMAVGAIRILLGITWAIAGIAKAKDRRMFLEALNDLGIVPAPVRDVVSFGVPTFEIGVGLLLVSAIRWRAAAAASIGALALFTIAIIVRLAKRGKGECACFGALSRSQIGPSILVRNSFLVVCSAFVFYAGPGYPALRVLTDG